MARIFPFRALRYNPSLVNVADCVTQPYDKITPAMQQGYYARSPYNLVRVILGLPELFDVAGSDDVYTRAAREFADWRAARVLVEEAEPCVYGYSQQVQMAGETVERRGVIALGALSPYSAGVVFRHEQTHSRARADRMELLKATRAHFGQIFMLYADPAGTVESLVFPAAGVAPEIEVRDELGVLHRVWKLSDGARIRLVQSALADKKLMIADGHHRYETALAYAEAAGALEGEPAGGLVGAARPGRPEAAVMMTLVNMDGGGGGLRILATHRVVWGLEGFTAEGLERGCVGLFSSVERVAELGAGELLEELGRRTRAAGSAATGSAATVMLAVMADRVLALRMDAAARAGALPGLSERRRQLDLAVLHDGVLDGLLGVRAEAVAAGEHVRYERDAGEAVAAVRSGAAQVAFLVNAVGLEQLREHTFAGEVMPQKSTDFYPKLLSGLTVYALDAGRGAGGAGSGGR